MDENNDQEELFGEPLVQIQRLVYPTGGIDKDSERKKRRTPTRPAGYAAKPGTGPEGHTCGDCKHHVIIQYSKNYHKCSLVRKQWTGGTATDILVRSPACELWQEKQGKTKKIYGG